MSRKIFIVGMLMILGCLLCSCAKNEQDTETYPIFDLNGIKELIATRLDDVYYANEEFYLLSDHSVYRVDPKTEQTEMLTAFEELQLTHCAGGPDGSIWVAEKKSVTRISADGKSVSRYELDETIVDIAIDSEGLLCLAHKNRLVIYDSLFVSQAEYPAPEDYTIGSLLCFPNGDMGCQADSSNSYARGPVLKLGGTQGLMPVAALVDTDGNPINECNFVAGNELFMPVALQGDAASVDNICVLVHQFDLGTGQFAPSFDTAGLELTGAIRGIVADGETLYVLYESADGCYLAQMTKSDQIKQLLTIARVTENLGEVSSAVLAFNVSSRDYYITNIHYRGENAEFRLRMDLVQGKAPDILPLAAVNYEPLAHAGLIANLDPWLEAEQMLKTHLNSALLNAVRWQDGSLYYIPATYSVFSAYADREIVGAYDGRWSATELAQYMEEYPAHGVLGAMSAWDKVKILLGYDLSHFVDRETLTCNLDSAAFQRYLAYLKEICLREYDADVGHLLHGTQIQTLRQYKEFLLRYGDRYTLTGFPTEQGSGVYAVTQHGFVVTKNSGNEQGAWAFLKFLLGEEYQRAVRFLPVRDDILEERLMQAVNGFEGAEERSDSLVMQIASGQAEGMQGPASGPLDGLTESEITAFRELVKKVDTVQTVAMDTQIEIIYEELVPYLRGEKTVEEVTILMQDRLSTYLSEQE